jgi:hypothetical protein
MDIRRLLLDEVMLPGPMNAVHCNIAAIRQERDSAPSPIQLVRKKRDECEIRSHR